MGTAIVGVLLLCGVILILKNMVRDKKKGKSLHCGCDCSKCRNASGH